MLELKIDSQDRERFLEQLTVLSLESSVRLIQPYSLLWHRIRDLVIAAGDTPLIPYGECLEVISISICVSTGIFDFEVEYPACVRGFQTAHVRLGLRAIEDTLQLRSTVELADREPQFARNDTDDTESGHLVAIGLDVESPSFVFGSYRVPIADEPSEHLRSQRIRAAMLGYSHPLQSQLYNRLREREQAAILALLHDPTLSGDLSPERLPLSTLTSRTLVPIGAYSASTTYQEFDLVSYLGSSYIWKSAVSGNTLPPSGDWLLLAAGVADPVGATGGIGLTGAPSSPYNPRDLVREIYLDVRSNFANFIGRKENIPIVCQGCRNYHGKTYGGNMLVCAIHPQGMEASPSCPDFETGGQNESSSL